MTLFAPGRHLPLPTLDDRTFDDLVAEARALIPAYDPDWTDHNASDPGITLIELLAWVTEMLIYSANQVTKEHTLTFLRLLNGPEWPPAGWTPHDLDADIATTLRSLRARSQAVTSADHEAIAAEVPGVGRVVCVPRRNLRLGTEPERLTPAPGHISLLVVPADLADRPPAEDPGGAWQPAEQLRRDVEAAIEPRRVLTTRVHAVGPVYAPVRVTAIVARTSELIDAATLAQRVAAAIERYLHPLAGGDEGTGAPAGRSVYASDLYALVERIDGVDHVPEVMLASAFRSGQTRSVAAPELWNPDGTQLGLGLAVHHLPIARVDPADVLVSDRFARVLVLARVDVAPSTPTHELVAAVRRRFDPRGDGPDGSSPWSVSSHEVADDLFGVDGVTGVTAVRIEGDRDRVTTDPFSGTTVLSLPAGELVELDVAIERAGS